MSGHGAEAYLHPRDLEYAETLGEDERETVVETVSRFRRPERLRVSDPVPPVELLRLEDGAPGALRELAGGRPLVLVFGSFT